MLQRYGEALADYERALQLDAANPYFYVYKGKTLAQLQRFEDAAQAYEKALLRNPALEAADQGKKEIQVLLDRHQVLQHSRSPHSTNGANEEP